MGEIRVKTADGWQTLPAHEKTADGWKDIPTHIMTATGWQGELTSQSPLKFWADGEMLDYRVYGANEGVGDKTENLFGTNRSGTISTVSAVCNGSEIAVQSDGTNILVSATAPVWKNISSINLSAGNYGYKIERTGTTTGIISSLYDANNALVASSQVSGTFTLSEDKSIYIGFFIPANTTANGTIKLTIVEGSTVPPSYIPYGYKIPMEVGDCNTNETMNLYIGSTPLDQGEYTSYKDQKIFKDVSGVLTPTDPPVPIPALPTIQGNNTLTVDTAVQPSKVFVKFEG